MTTRGRYNPDLTSATIPTHASRHEVGGDDLVSHDSLTDFAANEHIDHSTVSVSAGGILTGGGTIAANRTISLASSGVDHDATTNFAANEHIDHTTVSVSAGGILTGGGTIAATRTISLANSGVDHDATTNFVANEHIDWTSASADLSTSGSVTGSKLAHDASTYIDKDGSNNMTFTDAVVGTRTLKQLGCPTYKYIKAATQSEGDLHLSGATWAVSKALIQMVRVVTSSTNWDLYILQNDNSYATDDANIPKLKIAGSISGNANIMLNTPYEDEDASSEVHLYWTSASGVDTADFYILGFELL